MTAGHQGAILYDSLLISPRVIGFQYRSRSTAGTLPNTVASASSSREK